MFERTINTCELVYRLLIEGDVILEAIVDGGVLLELQGMLVD